MSTIYDKITISNPSGGLTSTYNGTQINVDTPAVSNVLKAEVTFESTQNLNGYGRPWPAGGYVNHLPYPYTSASQTKSGVTFTMSADGVTMNGTATAEISISLSYQNLSLVNGSYYAFYGGTKTYNTDGVGLYIDSDYGDLLYDEGSGIEFRYYTDDDLLLGIKIKNGTRLSNVKFTPMLTVRASKGAQYSPYANICSFSSAASSILYKRASATSSYINQYSKSFNKSIYFGTFDYVSGQLISEYAAVALTSTDFEWSVYNNSSNSRAFRAQIPGMYGGSQSQCDKDKCYCTHAVWSTTNTYGKYGWFYYANGYVYFMDYGSPQKWSTVDDFKAWLDAENAANTPVTILYPLATPEESTLTRTTLQTTAGVTYWDTSSTESSRRPLTLTIRQTTFNLPRPLNFNVQREDIYAGQYTTCTGETRSDRIGWKYSDMSWSWDALNQIDVEKLCSLSGECTLTFDDPLGDSIEEQFIRKSVVSMRSRNKFKDEYWWTGVSCSISFIESHTD